MGFGARLDAPTPEHQRSLVPFGVLIGAEHLMHGFTLDLAVLRAKIKIKNPRIRAGIGPKPTIPLGKWQSGPSPGTPRAKDKIKNHFKHSQVDG